MNFYKELQNFSGQVITHAVLLSVLEEYKRPNDKIGELVEQGYITRLKRGVYILGELFENSVVSKELIANLLYGPSYVSLEYALSYYGLIPERVYEITSVTTRLKKKYETPVGRFSYIKSPLQLYKIGITNYLDKELSYLIATPEKALCDKIVFTKNLRLGSQYDMRTFLEEDLRIDLDDLAGFDLGVIRACADTGHKARPLSLLYALLRDFE